MRDIPIVGSFVLECGDKSRVKQNKNAFKVSRVRRKSIRGKEESSIMPMLHLLLQG